MPASSPDPVAVSLLAKARASKDDLQARLLLAAAVARVAASIGVPVVVTGGTAVDFYAAGAAGTSAGYPAKWRASGDVDLVVIAAKGPPDAVRRLMLELKDQLGVSLQEWGTNPDGSLILGRAIDVPDFGYGLEIVGDELRGDPQAEHVVTVEVEGHWVALRGPEDTVISYAESAWATWDRREWERALAVYRAMKATIDVPYLQRRAAERRMPAVLVAVMEQQPLPMERQPLR